MSEAASGIRPLIEPARLIVEAAQVVLHEADESDALAHLCDAHALAGEHMTEVDLSSAKADPAAAGHHDRLIVKRISQALEATIDAGGARIEVRRHLHPSAWCGRSVLSRVTKSSKRACCWKTLAAAGFVAAFFRVRWTQDCHVLSGAADSQALGGMT